MTREPLKIGVLGYRFMGRAHANAMARLPMFFPDAPEIERHTLVGRDEAALADAADRFGFAHTATDWEAAIDEVDVFYNLGPNHVHAEPSIAALEAGVPVLCEKPLAPTLEEAAAMRGAAAATDVTSGTAFNYRFVPAICHAKRLIEDGALGEIRQVRGRYLQDWLVDPEAPWAWRMDADMAGSGALSDLGAHTLDLARFLVGDRVGEFERVAGQLTTFVDERPVHDEDGGVAEYRDVTVDDAYSAQVEYESGATGTFEASRVAEGHKNDHTIAVHGTKGSLKFSLERLNELEVLREGNRGYETVLVTEESDPYVDRWWPPGHVIGWEHTFVHENYEFLSAVAEGESFEPSFADGYEVQRVLAAIERADERGERVPVE
ncbi:Gfo/Idh/MocA family oxidoreductase [Halorubrum ezzemoulense]|uniref:Gfo/Idh/MocA family oxidoreductase n=1 Tax=Halorubrum ezzemoulense TaxID=337243 RepID=A0ABT4YZQ7_HALEZ|nr:Gfo/Idh/MocA family oxidoreductase [Halorubrum ezzemoulense]MDB2243482.1 Gfo/Idh/MocA family oxidoreductase [Halorubrum ezzemoulense]MDB2251548.1 Gfo/Idh/MocA family oxidoreductase [Halorubrum ezzemoulense]MDB2277218.1 Gfo/Idh/MocA family oxidoreductase [Halorubrum ezzemoulense]MDB2283928.1 Gfo/Idh/MocA family oxidoreductase [Halorubrum ezzemoulense]MDB2288845.1 Gfo/Idh/MocA family oxidoreductase [Halorubrum ezzemoulense]